MSGNANIDNNCFMENREQEILSEIKSMMASIRSQLEQLDAKMAELQQVVDPVGFEANSVNIEIDDIDVMPEPVAVESVEIPLVLEEPEPEPEPSPEPEPVQPEEEDDDLPFGDLPEVKDDAPGIFEEPEIVTVASRAADAAKPTINDSLAADQAWRKDMPGTPVRDIRSAISLNDRVIFINLLFDEDAQAFVDTLLQINSMETLDQVVDYVIARYPHWDLNSELVYRFMMSVRRKVK